MANDRLRGLKGLPGLNTLSEEERKAFLLDNEAKLKNFARNPRLYRQAADILYNNQQFIANFGEDEFNASNDGTEESYDARNERLKSKVINDAAERYFGDDGDYSLLRHELDDEGWQELIESDYKGTQKRQELFNSATEASKEVIKDYDAAINNPYTDALGAGFMQTGKESAAAYPKNRDEEYRQKDIDIREGIFAEVQKRREESVSSLTNAYYNQMYQSDANGDKTLKEYLDDFDKLASNKDVSPHYLAFKNSDWLKDYTEEEKLKDYAKYIALTQAYGQDIATVYFDRNMQNRITEAQDGKFTGNTIKSIGTIAYSDLGSNIAMFSMIGKSFEEIGILNQGKDPSKPIYDKDGNIVDYEDNEGMWTNPAYWNDVQKYNQFSPSAIKATKANGGISDDTNIREYGHVPDFISWESAEEALKQSGHIMASIAETALLGGVGKGTGAVAKKGLSYVLDAAKLAKVSKAGSILNDVIVTGSTGFNGANPEAMGTYEEMLQSSKERIQEQIRHELHDYMRNIDLSTPEAQAGIKAYYDYLKQEDQKKRVAMGESIIDIPSNDEMLLQQAVQHYTNDLIQNKSNELQELHKKDELEAATVAARAWATDLALYYVKTVPITATLQKYKIAKGSLKGAFDNAIKDNIITDEVTGGVKAAKTFASARNVAKEMAKNALSEGFDEYLDGINSAFSEGIGTNEFTNYINRNYNPEAYAEVTNGILSNLLAGVSSVNGSLLDRDNLYEAYLGLLSAGSVSPNINAVFTPRDTWNAVFGGTDQYGEKLDIAERLSSVVMNPLLEAYSKAKSQDRESQHIIDAVNEIVEKNKGNIEEASKLLLNLNDYSSPIINFNNPLKDLEEAKSSDEIGSFSTNPSILDSKDRKLQNVFNLIEALNSLKEVEAGTVSSFYKRNMELMENLANGTLSDEEMNEEIDKFITAPENKSLADDPNKREIAAERLQKNAQYFMEIKERLDEVEETFAKSPSMKGVDPRVRSMLKYNIAAQEDYKKRLEILEKEIDVKNTDTSNRSRNLKYVYGIASSRKNAINARQTVIDRLIKKIKALENDITSLKEKAKEIKKTPLTEENKDEVFESALKNSSLVKAKEFQINSLKEQIRKATNEKQELSALGDEELEFTEDEILNLNATDRAAVLNPNNRGNFSENQQAIINQARGTLIKKDPEAIDKVIDAGILAARIQDLDDMYSKIQSNKELAAEYFDAAVALRNRNAAAEIIQQEVENKYSKVEEAYSNYSKNKGDSEFQVFKNLMLSSSIGFIKAYMEDHPEQSETIKPLLELQEMIADVRNIIVNGNYDDIEKQVLFGQFLVFQRASNNTKELIQHAEDLVDADSVDETLRTQVDEILSKLDEQQHLRDSTVIENRKQKKRREEEEAKRREGAQKRLQEQAEKEAAEKAAAEEDQKKKEAAVKAAEESGNLEDVNVLDSSEESNDTSEKRFQVGDVVTGANYDKDGNLLDTWTATVRKVFDDGAFEIDGGVQFTSTMVKAFFGEVNPQYGHNAYSAIISNSRLGDATPYNKAQKKESSDNKEDVVKSPTKSVTYSKVTVEDLLKDPNLENETVNAGLITHGTKNAPKKDDFIVKLSHPTSVGAPPRVITFSVDGKPIKLDINRKGWKYSTNVTGQQEGSKALEWVTDDSIFEAQSIEFINGKWYFNGTFEGEDDRFTIYLEVDTDNFDINKAIENQKQKSEDALVNDGYDPTDSNIEVTEDNGQAVIAIGTPPLELSSEEDATVEINDDTADNAETANDNWEEESASGVKDTKKDNKDSKDNEEVAKSANSGAYGWRKATFSGSSLNIYEPAPLHEDGAIVPRKGDGTSTDTFSPYTQWLKDNGINLQDIIDKDLHYILEQHDADNPLKFKFMSVRRGDGVGDNRVQHQLFLVVDYDEDITPNIKNIHPKDGAVIESYSEGKRKEYLIVGVVGYGDIDNPANKERLEAYDVLFSKTTPKSRDDSGYRLIAKAAKQYFDKSTTQTTEKFYVHTAPSGGEFTTEMVPGSLIPGWIVKQLDGETEPVFRKVSEILSGDKKDERNPDNLKLEDLGWRIQTPDNRQAMTINANSSDVMSVKSIDKNAGNVFVLIPAANGKLIPCYIVPVRFNEMRNTDSKLKQEIIDSINKLPMSDYATRLRIIKDVLSQVFYFNKEKGKGPTVLINRTNSKIAFINEHGNKVCEDIDLASPDLNREELIEAFYKMNPRINITPKVLKDTKMLKMYDDAGILTTDIARMYPAGASYNVWIVNANGEMQIPKDFENPVFSSSTTDRNKDRALILGSNKYRFDRINNKFYLGSTLVTDEETIKRLEYIRRCIDGEITPATISGDSDIFILDRGDHPKVISRNRLNGKITELSEEDSRKIIETVDKKEADAKRKLEAGKQLETSKDTKMTSVESVDDLDDVAEQPTTSPAAPIVTRPEEKKLEGEESEENKRSFKRGYEFVIKNEKDIPLEDLLSRKETYEKFANEETKPDMKAYYEGQVKAYEELIAKKKNAPSPAPVIPENPAEASLEQLTNNGPTQTFKQLYSGSHNAEIDLILYGNDLPEGDPNRIPPKWDNIPDSTSELVEFLKNKGVKVDNIGTSEEDIKIWIETLKNCK